MIISTTTTITTSSSISSSHDQSILNEPSSRGRMKQVQTGSCVTQKERTRKKGWLKGDRSNPPPTPPRRSTGRGRGKRLDITHWAFIGGKSHSSRGVRNSSLEGGIPRKKCGSHRTCGGLYGDPSWDVFPSGRVAQKLNLKNHPERSYQTHFYPQSCTSPSLQ